MKKFALLSLTVALACGTGSRADDPTWATVAPAQSGFSALMPGTPIRTTTSRRDPVFGSITFKVHVAQTDAAVFQVIHCDMPAWAVRGEGTTPRQLINLFGDGFSRGAGATALSRQEIQLGGNPGLSYLLHLREQGLYTQARLYLVGNRVYMVMAASMNRDAVSSPYALRFFNSFRLGAGLDATGLPAMGRGQ